MANEFEQVIELIAAIVTWLLNRTLDLICSLLFIISMIFPWRWIGLASAKKSLFSSSDRGEVNVHVICAGSMIGSLFDMVTIFPTVIGLLTLRCHEVIKALTNGEPNDGSDFEKFLGYSVERRFSIWGAAVNGVIDNVCFVLLCLSLALPWRWAGLVNKPANHNESKGIFGSDDFQAICLYSAFGSFFDIITAPFFIVAMLTLRCRSVCNALFDEKLNVDGDEVGAVLGYSPERRTFILASAFLGVLDNICFLFFLFSMILPWRWVGFATSKKKDFFGSEDFHFICLYSAACSVLDMLTVPFFMIAIMTLRCRSVCGALFDEKMFDDSDEVLGYSCKRRHFIWTAAALGVVDNICFLMFLVSMILPWRWVGMANASKGIFEQDEFMFQTVCATSFFLSVFDLITIPAFCIGCLTFRCWFVVNALFDHGLVVKEEQGRDPLGDSLGYSWKRREEIWGLALEGIVDNLCFVLGVAALFVPTCTISILWKVAVFVSQRCKSLNADDQWSGYGHEPTSRERTETMLATCRAYFVMMAFFAVCDLVALPVGLLGALVPTRTGSFVTCILFLLRPENRINSSVSAPPPFRSKFAVFDKLW